MHFSMKNYLKSNRYPTTKQFLNLSISSMDTESSLDLPYLVTVLLSPCRLVQKTNKMCTQISSILKFFKKIGSSSVFSCCFCSCGDKWLQALTWAAEQLETQSIHYSFISETEHPCPS
jgi:hypothetical protein